MRGGRFAFGFGGKDLSLEALTSLNPGDVIQSLKQTHSDIVLQVPFKDIPDSTPEGDALITQERGQVLIIRTADCLPVLVYDETTSSIAAIHAGWRGVAKSIVPKCLQKLRGLGATDKTTEIFIGPHIRQQSFQCGLDVADTILRTIGRSTRDGGGFVTKVSSDMVGSSGKCFLDLEAVVIEQIFNCYGTPRRLETSPINVFLDSDFHSFRRDKDGAGRNISWIKLL